jgi:hypothetical protein
MRNLTTYPSRTQSASLNSPGISLGTSHDCPEKDALPLDCDVIGAPPSPMNVVAADADKGTMRRLRANTDVNILFLI